MKSKFGAVATIVDGIRFASKAEARRYQELRMLEKAGIIRDLQCQIPYELLAKFTHQGRKYSGVKYVADFKYFNNATGAHIVEDVKGAITPAYRIKRAMLLSQNPELNFIEVKA